VFSVTKLCRYTSRSDSLLPRPAKRRETNQRSLGVKGRARGAWLMLKAVIAFASIFVEMRDWEARAMRKGSIAALPPSRSGEHPLLTLAATNLRKLVSQDDAVHNNESGVTA
jgi:hypothetical protein